MYDDDGREENGMLNRRIELSEELIRHYEYEDGQPLKRDW